jgi:CRISPR/Cas system CSM-associated protein Csm3 (group 7 of RAMP superfamily)
MSRFVHRLALDLVFPSGISPGEGKDGNVLIVARDGRLRPVLRGTALAGALRHGLRGTDTERWFGRPLEGKASTEPSPLRVPDCVIETGQEENSLVRTHNAIDRHTGAVLPGGLFSLQVLPPGCRTQVLLWLHDEGEAPAAKAFLGQLVALLESGLTLGGHAARGIGRVEVAGAARYRLFDCGELEQHAEWLDEHRAWRKERKAPMNGEDLALAATPPGTLSVDLVLAIPAAQDLLVGDGQGLDHELEPQRVRCADGTERWRIPGSALRGVFRAWMTRLAARAGLLVADSLHRRRQLGAPDGDDLAWGLDPKDGRAEKQDALAANPQLLRELVPCPIMRLFGSGYSKARIHFADALSDGPCQPGDQQRRAHVAVDRLTGGANEGFFFDSAVLAGPVRFEVTITIREVEEQEAKWLVSTIRALDLGVLRVGSSKAGGAIELAAPPRAVGPHRELLASLAADRR